MKQFINKNIKAHIKHSIVLSKDIMNGEYKKLVKYNKKNIIDHNKYIAYIIEEQPIKTTSHSENKKKNIRTACKRINNLKIMPGQIFSFWKLVGKPSKKRNYLAGRTIIDDKLTFDYGGGLCQLSGILYILALKAGFIITERHNHSFDLYDEKSRYTPLGSDATVAFGYKDLRFENNTNVPVCFRIVVENKKVSGMMCAEENIDEYKLEFITEIQNNVKKVETVRCFNENESETVNTSLYMDYIEKLV